MNPDLRRVLFVCIGNSCRSQMAEGFARAYGSDVIVPASAGLAPAVAISPNTVRAMEEKNIDVRVHFPKSLRQLGRVDFDLVINMSGTKLPGGSNAPVRAWEVPDPIGQKFEIFQLVRDHIERLVMELIIEFRRVR